MPNDTPRSSGAVAAGTSRGLSASARRSFSWAALVAGLVLFLAVNVLSNAWLRAGCPAKRMQGVPEDEE